MARRGGFSPHRRQSVDHSVSRSADADDGGGLQPGEVLGDAARLQRLHGPDQRHHQQRRVL